MIMQKLILYLVCNLLLFSLFVIIVIVGSGMVVIGFSGLAYTIYVVIRILTGIFGGYLESLIGLIF